MVAMVNVYTFRENNFYFFLLPSLAGIYCEGIELAPKGANSYH